MSTTGRSLGVFVLAVTVAVVVTGCTSTSTAEPSGAAPAPSTTAEPGRVPSTSGPVPSASAAPSIPTECRDLVSDATYQRLFAGVPLNDPAVVTADGRDPGDRLTGAASAGPAISCTWRDPAADVTGLTIEVQTVDPVRAATVLASLGADGFTCADHAGGQRCQSVHRDGSYPVDVGETYFARSGIGIFVYQANVATSGLLDEVIAAVL